MVKGVVTMLKWGMEPTPLDTPCDEYEGSLQRGRAVREIDNKTYYVARLVWEEANGPIPEETPYVLHHCDNPKCIRLDHLWLGTQEDNVADRQRKNRQAKGENIWTAKLTETDVREIRATYVPKHGNLIAFARRYGVTKLTMRNAITGKNWKHVQ